MSEGLSNTSRSLPQVIFRHTPGSMMLLDDFNVYAQVKEIKGEQDQDVNKELLFKNVQRTVDKWRDASEGRVSGFETHMTSKSLAAIRPKGIAEDSPAVFCDLPYPTGFRCVREDCQVYADANSPDFTGTCIRCNSPLKQMPYVWFHLCGSIFGFGPLKQISCPNHGKKYLWLHDTGRFQTSVWQCRECNAVHKGIGMMGCNKCTLTDEEKLNKQQFLRGSVWNDSWVYNNQTVSFVNLESTASEDLLNASNAEVLILDSLTGRIKAGNSRVIGVVNTKIVCKSCGKEIDQNAKFCPNCGHPQDINTTDIDSSNSEKSLQLSQDSALVTFVTLRDLERTLSLRDAVGDKLDKLSASSVGALLELTDSGINDILYIEDFPLTTAAIGYSRQRSGPPAWLNAFPATSYTGTKIPIYTNCITSEAWMVKLSGKMIVSWIIANNLLDERFISEAKDFDEGQMTIWLAKKLSQEEKKENENELYSLVYNLVHSYSHLMLKLLGINSGLDESSLGELLLVESLSFINYAGESDLGGLSALFGQGLGVISSELAEYGRVCKFDPSCQNDDNGVCVGCLYTSRGCINFNNDLSRSFLYGGIAKIGERPIQINVGFIDITK